MSASCSTPIPWEELVSYWAGDLDPRRSDGIDEHLMGCGICSASSARVAAVTESVRAMIPAFLSHERLAVLRARGVRVVENLVLATERKTAVFPTGADVLLHRLEVDLTAVERIEITVTDESTGQILLVDPRVPFDPTTGEILVACQRHFGEETRTIVFEVSALGVSGASQLSRFAIPHVFEPR